MRKGDAGMRRMLSLTAALLISSSAIANAAVSGSVVNGTSGKPQAGLAVTLIQASAKGMEPVGKATTNAAGEFSFDKQPTAGAPFLLQAVYQGVTYSKGVAPGQPATGIALEVFETTNKPANIAVDRHGILLEPVEGKLAVREFVFVNNTGKATYSDPAAGTYRFWAPDDAKINVSLTTAGGMPVTRPATKAGGAGAWKVDYPLRPGQTQIEVSYEVPKTDTFAGNILHKEGETRLIVPKGFALQGQGLEEFAPEPRTQAAIYGVKNGPFSVTITGKAAPVEREEDSGAPEVGPGRPRIYSKMTWILGLMGGILLVGIYSLAKSK